MPQGRRKRDRVADIALDAASPLLDFTESALELVPVPGLPLIAKSLSVLVDRVKSSRANKDSQRAFIEQTKALAAALKEMMEKASTAMDGSCGDERVKERLMDGIAHSEDLRARVDALSSTIVELRERTKELKGGPGFLGFLKGVLFAKRNEDTLAEMKDEMAKALELFKLRGQIRVETVLDNVIREAQDIRNALKDADDQKALESIVRAPAGYRSVDELKSQFMEGTREKLFGELTLWSTGHFPEGDPKQIYFLSGAAGLGKSSIAHQFCARLDSPERHSLAASFFFVRGNGDLESTRLFFPTLAYQFATSQPQLQSRIISAAREYHRRGDRQQMRHAFEDLVRTPLLDAPIGDQGPIVLVIDGLDECKERDMIPSLLRFLLELVRTLPWLRVFVTSRPEPHVLGTLTSSEATTMVHHRNLDDTVKAWEGDVARYLKDAIPRISSYTQFVHEHPEDLEHLINRAGGIFIYARIAVSFLDMYQHNRPKEQFDLLLSSLGVGVEPLDALYLQVLWSAFPPKHLCASSPDHERLRAFLTSITLLLQPQSPGVIALFWPGMTRDDIVFMIDRLRSVLLVDAHGIVRPIHATLGEFLLDEARCTDPLYHVDRLKGNGQFASACFSAFSFQTMTDCLAVSPAQEETGAIWQYVRYAFVSWNEHLKDAEFSKELLAQLHALNSHQVPIRRRGDWSYTASSTLFEIRSLRKWLETSLEEKDTQDICCEYAHFSTYSHLWWKRILSNPDDLPVITPDEVTAHLSDPKLDKELRDSGIDVGVQSGETARYQAAHERLVKEIEDAGVTDTWLRQRRAPWTHPSALEASESE